MLCACVFIQWNIIRVSRLFLFFCKRRNNKVLPFLYNVFFCSSTFFLRSHHTWMKLTVFALCLSVNFAIFFIFLICARTLSPYAWQQSVQLCRHSHRQSSINMKNVSYSHTHLLTAFVQFMPQSFCLRWNHVTYLRFSFYTLLTLSFSLFVYFSSFSTIITKYVWTTSEQKHTWHTKVYVGI